jgi:hypothetical protein
MLECSKCHKSLQDMLKQKAEDKTSQSTSRLS